MRIELLPSAPPPQLLEQLSNLLIDAVRHGASLGFLESITQKDADEYWANTLLEINADRRVAFGAFDGDGRLLGTGQLALEMRPNGRHRAEVQKILVWHACRGRGIGAAILATIEEAAIERRRTLLFLDTSIGEAGAVAFYEKRGYVACGGIPDYAANPDGKLVANAIFYKRLG